MTTTEAADRFRSSVTSHDIASADRILWVFTQVPEGRDIHIVMDNYATHKTSKIKAWLARRPHYHVHFTPTSASWINQVELSKWNV